MHAGDARSSGRGYQLVERDMLACERVQGAGANPPDKLAKGAVGRIVTADRQEIEHRGNERLGVLAGPPGHRAPDREILLTTMPGQDDLKCRQDRYEERRSLT